MMVHYETPINNESDDEDVELSRTELVYSQLYARGPKWPRVIGVVEIIAGFIITILGVTEVFILPLLESRGSENLIVFEKENCFGVSILAGLTMVLTGSTVIRATMSRRDTTVVRFFNLTILCLLVYAGLTLFLVTAYAKGWTTVDHYQPGSRIAEVHFFVTVFSILGLIFAVTGFVQYFSVICCGPTPVWLPWVQFCCGCCYNRSDKAEDSEMAHDVAG
ncbi:uncharacterized protein LOC131950636 isoform X2 [Physella acuta]|uniref:uncharacterized protein LOC131950636 isoform X2 n=1 Tax=Physella acuta TaxID=109671 RepID=UPI0027DE0B7B|nr:uncharacterized protein LOC131950636 isoform X2 [Physella acuta]